MDDRKLLTLAAKAAGITGWWGDKVLTGEKTLDFSDFFFVDAEGGVWDPLSHDSDAFRLAVDLRLTLKFDETTATANETAVKIETDAYAAMRRAIVIAAAEIARAA